MAQQAMADLLVAARATLTEPAYIVFLDFLADVVAAEAARCLGWRLNNPDDFNRQVMS